MAQLLDIATRTRPRVPMDRHSKLRVTREAGLDGDFRGLAPDRNVTVLSREGWQAACQGLCADLPWTTRRRNLLVEGVESVGGFLAEFIGAGDVDFLGTGSGVAEHLRVLLRV